MKLLRNYQANRMLYWMLFPVIVYVLIFNYLPMSGLIMSFQDYAISKGVFGSRFIGLKNFSDFFHGLYFTRTLRNTLILGGLDLLFNFPAAIVFALLLNEVGNLTFKKIVQTISYMPHFISLIVVAGLILEFTNSSGVFSAIAQSMGGPARSYITFPQYFRTIFTVSSIWQSIGFDSIIYLSALAGVSEELYEAARIDGAGRFRQALHVTLPGILPTIIIMLILRCGSIMNVNFEKVLLLYSPSTYETADIISTYVYRIGIIKQKIGFSTAVGLFNSAVSLLMILGANALSKKYTEISMF